MITAAFEWTFNKNYPDGITKKPKTIEAENAVTKELDRLINESQGKQKKIYKSLKNHISLDSLKPKIEQIGKDYAEIIEIFGKHLYSINHETLKYSEMGLRLSEQRNNFAHGNLDKDFVDLSILDLVYLERIIYAMQLKEYGLEKISIQRAINDLFSCHIRL